MPPKAVLAASILAVLIILGPLGTQNNTSITELSKQLIEWYREIITQLVDN